MHRGQIAIIGKIHTSSDSTSCWLIMLTSNFNYWANIDELIPASFICKNTNQL